MARIRTIKPEFFVSEQVADVSPTCRLLFVGMWLFCDDAGIHPASARQLKMEVFPGDDITTAEVQGMVEELLRVGLLIEYEATDDTQIKRYWQVTGWHHQKIERPRYQYPQPDSTTCRRYVADTSTTPRSLTVPETTVPEPTEPEPTCRKRQSVFVPPTSKEVAEYAGQQGYSFDAERFVDFYTSKKWKVGRNSMADWKAAVRNANREGWCRPGGQARASPASKPTVKDLLNRAFPTKDNPNGNGS